MKQMLIAMAGSAALLLSAAPAQAQSHQHGVVSLSLTLDNRTLSLALDAPLEDIVGFERAPRTAAEKAAAAAALKQLDPGAALWQPNAEAGCRLTATRLDAPVLQQGRAPAGDHADLQAGYEFECQQPDKLSSIRHALFTALPRIKRIDLQYALPGGQGKAQVRRPQAMLLLKR